MVGLVLVSHSRALANALFDLLRQVAPGEVQVAVAAGVGNDRNEFGTDAVEIGEAIQAVMTDAGVLVLMDLGSAVLSAQLAVELLPPEMADKVRFCAAPLVEGAIAAAVQAGLGSDLDTVCREANGALLAKQEQLGATPTTPLAPAAEPAEAGERLSLTVTLTNLHGLHARPAAQFVRTAAQFQSDVQVANPTTGKGPVSAKSLNALATLGAVEFHTVEITARGPDAAAALEALGALVAANFGEPPATAQPVGADLRVGPDAPTDAGAHTGAPLPSESGALIATPVSEGIVLGPFYRYQPPPPPISTAPAQDPAAEWQQLQTARATVRQGLQQRRQQVLRAAGETEAAIFDAHLLLLDDPDLLDRVRQALDARQNAAQAWTRVLDAVAADYRALSDPYLQQRAADVLDVRNQVLFALAGKAPAAAITLDEPVIVYAADLTPSETSQLDMSRVLGIITSGGGPTSHSAILARALGIPAVAGASPALEQTAPGALVALDGFRGAVWVQPSAEVQAQLEAQRDEWLAQRQQLLAAGAALAQTRDGRRVEVFANIGSAADAARAVDNGAEGVGLLRTEFLFLTRATPPNEAEQLEAYRLIGAAMQGRVVTARTLDIGGDKEAPYVNLPAEANPFLGVRAIRLSLHDTGLFQPQLRALLRAAAEFPYRIMFPMVANLDEVRQARRVLEAAHAALEAEGVAHAWPIEVGIMVEVPSAALLADALAQEVDFFSIGTNDLTQYTLAAERGNPLLAGLADALHPSVLRLIGEVAAAAHAAGKWVGVCGELAGDPAAAAALIGLGVDELSLNPGSIPRIKSIVRQIDTAAAQELAQAMLRADGAPAARRLAQEYLEAP